MRLAQRVSLARWKRWGICLSFCTGDKRRPFPCHRRASGLIPGGPDAIGGWPPSGSVPAGGQPRLLHGRSRYISTIRPLQDRTCLPSSPRGNGIPAIPPNSGAPNDDSTHARDRATGLSRGCATGPRLGRALRPASRLRPRRGGTNRSSKRISRNGGPNPYIRPASNP